MWKRALLYWWPIPLFHAFNVFAREFFIENYLGKIPALQLSTGVLLLFVFVYIWLSIKRMYPSGLRAAIGYGFWWLLYTLIADIFMNFVMSGFQFNSFLRSFDSGGFPYWLVIFLIMFVMPPAMYLIRRKKIRI